MVKLRHGFENPNKLLAEKDVREINKHSHTLLENVQRECKKYHDTGVQYVAIYSKTVSKAIYCFIDLAMCAYFLLPQLMFSLEWKIDYI